MKKLLFLVIILCTNKTIAQDIIVMKDGSAILSKVLEVSLSNVKYKKYSNLNGPIYTIDKSDIMSITYENGEKEDIKNENSDNISGNQNRSNRYIKKKAAANNEDLIKMHNNKVTIDTKKTNKSATRCINVFGMSQSSVLSNDEIEAEYKMGTLKNPHGKTDFFYNIVLTNKTNSIIYVDLGNCFRILMDGSYYCYYTNNEQTIVTQGGGSEVSIGLGSVAGIFGIGGIAGQLASGVNVGGVSSHSVSKSYVQQRIIAIPPHSHKNLTEEKWINVKKSDYEKIESAEEINFIKTNRKEGFLNCGDMVFYTEEESPFTIEYIITYSTSERFDTYSSLNFKLFIKESIGHRYWTNTVKDLHNDTDYFIWDIPWDGESLK